MSVTEQIIQDNPDKYESVLEARILGKQLQLKLNQYKALQNQYDLLLQTKNNNRKRSTGGWKQINGKLKQISAVGKDWLWGVNNSNQIFTCKKPCNDSSWINIPGYLSQVEGGESEVWGVNAVDNIFKMNVDHSSDWKQVTGKLTNISQGGGWVWGVNSSNNVYNIYRCKQPCDGNWILDSSSDTTPPGVKNLLKPNEYLTSNKYLVSNNKAFFLIMQSDGNLVVYKGSGPSDNKGALWSSGTSGKGESFAIMQSDGNFVVYKGSGPSDNKGFTWNSKTFGKGESFAIMQDDGNFVVYKGSGPSDNKGALWNSKTGGNTPPPTSVTPSLVQLSCSNTHVYGLDTSKNAWRKNIDGSGKWSKFGNPSDWQFYWINASNPDTVLAVGMNRHIYATNIDGTRDWYKADDQYNNIDNVSGDPENANYYVTNTSNDIYRHEPVEQDGNWKDLNNENYQMGMVSSPTQTSDDWKFLGKSDTLNDCKLKAVQDDAATFSSVVYYPSDFGNDWSKSCFGGIKGKNINSGYQSKTITSLAPNGTTALGGDEGEKIAKEMKKLQVQIKRLTKKIKRSGKGLDQTKTLLSGETVSKSEELEKLLVKMEKDRFEIDTLLRQPDELAGEEDSNIRQISSYTNFSLWLLLGLVSIYMSYYVYSRESADISMAVYVFIAIWILIIGKYYYRTVIDYGESFWKFISKLLPPIHVF
ncbi:hypothetical protein N9K75_01515 [bacterium]|nr:hypothetical protein [bacterium]